VTKLSDGEVHSERKFRNSRGSAVGRATVYRLDDRQVGVRFPVALRILTSPYLGPTQLHRQWVPGALSPSVKRQGREVDRSPSTSAELKRAQLFHMPSWHSA
jgi:hypothetical protein